MIFRIKHRWWLALLIVLVWSGLNGMTGGSYSVISGQSSLFLQVALGVGGAIAALAINGLLHEILQRLGGDSYLAAFRRYSEEILDGMSWPAYLAGGLMAGLVEEPFFRGVVLTGFDNPAVGILAAALLFALCHWIGISYLGFWFWALWEGILFGLLLVFSGALIVPMIAHGLHDAIGYPVLRLLLGKRDRRVDGEMRE